MDTDALSREKLNLFKVHLRNLFLRVVIQPFLFFTAIFLKLSKIIPNFPLGLTALIFLFTISGTFTFYIYFKKLSPNEENLKRIKWVNFTFILIETVLFTILYPRLGGIFTPYVIILILEVTAVTILFNLYYAAGLLLFFIVLNLFRLNEIVEYTNSISSIFSVNIYVFFIIFWVSVYALPILVHILIKPIIISEKDVQKLNNYIKDLEYLRKKTQQSYYLTTITSEIVASKNKKRVLNYLVEGIRNLLECGVVLLSVYDQREKIFKRAAFSGLTEDEWNKVKNQKIPYMNLQKLLKNEFKIHGGYYIPGKYVSQILDDNYTISFEDSDEKETKEMEWSPDDILLFPIVGRDNKILAYYTVDKPKERKIPNEDILHELTLFTNTAAIIIQNLEDLANLQNINNKLKIVYTVNEIITKLSQEENFLEQVVTIIGKSLHYLNVAVLLKEEDHLIVKANVGYSQRLIKNMKLRIGYDGITGWVAKWGIAQIIGDVTKDPRYIEGIENVKSELAIPIKYTSIVGKEIKEEILGVLDVASAEYNGFTVEDQNLLSLIASQLAIALKNRELLQKTIQLAKTDEMTQLLNYRVFKENLYKEIKRAKRYNHIFSLLMLDIDDFKKINDTYGHRAGDTVLRRLAQIMKNDVRDTDIVSRYGGEEFTIIMPETAKEDAYKTAERIRKHVENSEVIKEETGEVIQFTISIGVATFPNDGNTFETIVENVDKALYKAKRSGKNRVVKYDKEVL